MDDRELRREIIDMINELDTGDGISVYHFQGECERKRWNMVKVILTLERLKDEGEVYEPTLGKLKVTG